MATARRKKQQKVIKLIRKSNELVEGRYKFDVWETRVFTSMISMIKRSDDDFQSYRIYINDLVKEYGLENAKSPYQRVKIASQKLMSKIVRTVREEDGELMEFQTPIVAGIKNPKNVKKGGRGFVELSFHPDMKPLLLQLKEEFTTYDVRNVLRLPSTYSTRIYELLKQYEKIGRRRIAFNDIKLMVGASEVVSYDDGKEEIEDSYPLYGNFRQKVLLQAQKDLINHTDISFTFETVKKGRKVEEIIFYISKNVPRRDKGTRPASKQKESHIYNLIEPITKNWPDQPSKQVITKLLNSYSEENIQDACKYVENRRIAGQEIKNYVAYFRTIVKEVSKQGDLFNDPIQKQKNKAEENRIIKADKEEKRQILLAEISGDSELLKTKRSELLKDIKEQYTDIYDKVVEILKGHRFYDKKISYAENIARPSFASYEHLELKKLIPERYEEIEELQEIIKQKTLKANRI